METLEGTLSQLGQKKELEDSTEEVFNITQIPVDETGKILITTSNED